MSSVWLLLGITRNPSLELRGSQAATCDPLSSNEGLRVTACVFSLPVQKYRELLLSL